jgi:lipoate---protein ligase
MIRVLHLCNMPIYEQLLLEERLLRATDQNWCIINTGAPRAIVMGISGKKEELVDCERAEQAGIPLIKRFSGGGTVIVDEETLFVTLICQQELFLFPAYPEPILRWHEALYQDALQHPLFHLRENDFVIGEKKCGGNAQYIQKGRWLHHTSFLWNYAEENMSYLLMPKKTPPYRQGRAHSDFLCKLSDYFPSKEALTKALLFALNKRFALEPCNLEEVLVTIPKNDRIATSLINPNFHDNAASGFSG